MKCIGFAIALVVLAAFNGCFVSARSVGGPIAIVVDLMQKIQAKIRKDGKIEQASYDKLACFCEKTTEDKANEITKDKTKIASLKEDTVKNKGKIGANVAKISQLKSDVSTNLVAQDDANTLRQKELLAYRKERTEGERCLRALEQAIKVLSGAGTGKKGFLETWREAQLLSIVAGVNNVLQEPRARRVISDADMQVVQKFIEKPVSFVKKSETSSLQVSHNPFGDYAPQSTQIQGILKSMYDTFAADLEKNNAEEATQQKAYEDLMKTKKKEHAQLSDDLLSAIKVEATTNKQISDDTTMTHQLEELVDANIEFFYEIKTMCEDKAAQWTERTHLRTEEIAGLSKAIDILKKHPPTLLQTPSFLQLSIDSEGSRRREVYKHLKFLASKYQNLKLVQIAVSVKTGGHFDDIITMVDKMIGFLRDEAATDIKHRDRCQNKENANENAQVVAKDGIVKHKASVSSLDTSIKMKADEGKAIADESKHTQKSIDTLSDMRRKEKLAFKKSIKDDTVARDLVGKAMYALAKLYEALNKGALLQLPSNQTMKPRAITGTFAAVKSAPKTSVDYTSKYKGSSSQTQLLAVLEMIKVDFQKEIDHTHENERIASEEFERDINSLRGSLHASKKAHAQVLVEKADLQTKRADALGSQKARETDLSDEKKLKKAIATDCNWVKTHFVKREQARNKEMDGLVDAKDFLSGVGSLSDLSFS